MAEQYYIDCSCGRSIRVELFQAGTDKTCPVCQATVSVPNSIRLKELAGDKYPLLRPIEKIQRALEEGDPPFDGPCQACRTAEAEFQVPITFSVLVERHTSDDGGIRPTLTGGITLALPSSEEVWQTTRFPLLLCPHCHTELESAHQWVKALNIVKVIAVAGTFTGFLYYAVDSDIESAFLWAIALGASILWATRHRLNKNCDPFIIPWLQHVRWMPEAMAAEDEYRLSVGKSQPIEHAAK